MTEIRAIVTGAASGIGRMTALSLARSGARLVLADIDSEQLQASCRAVRDAGAQVEPVMADLADPAAASHVIEVAEQRLGGLDALVSNAGNLNDQATSFNEPVNVAHQMGRSTTSPAGAPAGTSSLR